VTHLNSRIEEIRPHAEFIRVQILFIMGLTLPALVFEACHPTVPGVGMKQTPRGTLPVVRNVLFQGLTPLWMRPMACGLGLVGLPPAENGRLAV